MENIYITKRQDDFVRGWILRAADKAGLDEHTTWEIMAAKENILPDSGVDVKLNMKQRLRIAQKAGVYVTAVDMVMKAMYKVFKEDLAKAHSSYTPEMLASLRDYNANV